MAEESHPGHTGIHLDMDGQRHRQPLRLPAERLPVFRGQHRLRHPVLGQLRGLLRRSMRNDQNRTLDARLPQLDSLLQIGYAEPIGAVLLQRAGDLHRPVSVGIRFDDAHDTTAGGKHPTDRRQIIPQPIQIHLGPGTM